MKTRRHKEPRRAHDERLSDGRTHRSGMRATLPALILCAREACEEASKGGRSAAASYCRVNWGRRGVNSAVTGIVKRGRSQALIGFSCSCNAL